MATDTPVIIQEFHDERRTRTLWPYTFPLLSFPILSFSLLRKHSSRFTAVLAPGSVFQVASWPYVFIVKLNLHFGQRNPQGASATQWRGLRRSRRIARPALSGSLFLAPFPTVLFSLQLSIISRTEFPRETKFSTPSARYKKKTSSA